MDKHRQPPPESTQPARDLQEDSLAPAAPPSPVEDQRAEPAAGVEREGIGPEEGQPEREILGPEEERPGRGARSEESI